VGVAPKGRNIIARGETLGKAGAPETEPCRGEIRVDYALSGLRPVGFRDLGRWPRLSYFAPSGLDSGAVSVSKGRYTVGTAGGDGA